MDLAATGPARRRVDDVRLPARWMAGNRASHAEVDGGLPPIVVQPPGQRSGPSPVHLSPERLSPETWAHNLPHALTSFVGREAELAEARRLLDSARLLTLTGAGGVGKTRLGHELAASYLPDFEDGVWLVELAAIADPSLVPRAVADVLGVRDDGERPLVATLAAVLRGRHLLLVLDTCEHLVEGCAALADLLLRACPGLRILATSRQVLGIAGEITFRVPSLSLPDVPADASPSHLGPGRAHELAATQARPDDQAMADGAASDAVRLFVERARAVVSSFTLTGRNAVAVEQICRQLDGIPLAIELAAARIAVLSPEQIADRLTDRFRLLTGGSRTALPRHQTLLALMDWSYDLLDERERVLFRRLAVFSGGWTLEAAESVCTGDGLEPHDVLYLLSDLVAKSLVLTDVHADAVRYSLLDSVRAYVAQKLGDAGEAPDLERRHVSWCASLAERAEPELVGADQASWLQRLDAEHDNLRAALRRAVDAGDTGDGLRLGAALYRFWETRGFIREGRRWLDALLAQGREAPASATAARSRTRALQAAGRLAVNAGDREAAEHLLNEALAVARAHDDRAGLAAGAFGLGYLARMRGEHDTARVHLQEALSLFRAERDPQGIAESLVSLGVVAHFQEDLSAAQSFYEAGLAIFRALGNRQGMAISLNDLGEIALDRGDPEAARRLEQESLTIANEIGDRERIAYALAALGGVAAMQGETRRALRLAASAAAIRDAIGETVSDAWQHRFERWMAPARQASDQDSPEDDSATRLAVPAASLLAFALSSDQDVPVSAPPPAPVTQLAPIHGPDRSPRAISGELVGADPLAVLTQREREVAALVVRGLTNRQIAAELVITEGTAANHVKHILARLGVESRVQIAAWAIEHGLPQRPPA